MNLQQVIDSFVSCLMNRSAGAKEAGVALHDAIVKEIHSVVAAGLAVTSTIESFLLPETAAIPVAVLTAAATAVPATLTNPDANP